MTDSAAATTAPIEPLGDRVAFSATTKLPDGEHVLVIANRGTQRISRFVGPTDGTTPGAIVLHVGVGDQALLLKMDIDVAVLIRNAFCTAIKAADTRDYNLDLPYTPEAA